MTATRYSFFQNPVLQQEEEKTLWNQGKFSIQIMNQGKTKKDAQYEIEGRTKQRPPKEIVTSFIGHLS